MSSSRISLVLLIANLGLFVTKLFVGITFRSLAVLSDAGNSLVDIVTAVVIYVAVRMGSQPADTDHPFGHSRAEPLAAFMVSVLTFVLAFEVAREAITRLIAGGNPRVGVIPALVIGGVIMVKGVMWFISKRAAEKYSSSALSAASADNKMDVVVSFMTLAGIAGINLGYPSLDAWAALAIAGWIGLVGFRIGKENIEKLLGNCPSVSKMQLLKSKLSNLKKLKEIRGFHDLRAHYVGSDIYVSVHIEADEKRDLKSAHGLEKNIQSLLKEVSEVTDVAVHMDPV